MPDTNLATAAAPVGDVNAGRPDRAPLLGFVADAASEAVLREGLEDAAPMGLELRRATIRQAIAALQKMPTPRTLIVDISGEEQPVSTLVDLSEIVEPDVRVLVIGDREDTNFYRQLTRGLGVVEYLYKPLTRGMVTRLFGPWIGSGEPVADTVQGGRIVSVTGVRGGAGATTIAANLAWHFGHDVRRHTLLLDPNLHTGDAALLLGAQAGSGLRTALETPDRIDELFIERTTHPAGDRLWVMASEEKLSEQPAIAAGAVQRLLSTVRRRYNFVIVDAPFQATQMHRDFLDLSHQRIIVLEPSLSSARDGLRIIGLPNGPAQARRPILVLNRAGQTGGLTTAQMEQAVGAKMDITIPFLPRLARTAASLGEPAVAARGPFRDAIMALAREAAFTRLVDAEVTTKPKRVSLRQRLGLGLKR
jgi:pilus assembly protein CpaE